MSHFCHTYVTFLWAFVVIFAGGGEGGEGVKRRLFGLVGMVRVGRDIVVNF